MKAREQRGRASSVETFVVIEDANPQDLNSLEQRKIEQPELLSIKVRAADVKAGAVWKQGNRISNLFACNVCHPERSEGSAVVLSCLAVQVGEAKRSILPETGRKATADPSSLRSSG
jgi:hypothetical protein